MEPIPISQVCAIMLRAPGKLKNTKFVWQPMLQRSYPIQGNYENPHPRQQYHT
jgi:hypothetical protein